MRVEDSFVVDAPIERVWAYITNPDEVAPCLPGCESVEVTGPKSYKASVKLAMGPIKTVFQVTVEVTAEEPPTFASSVTRGEEGGRASSLVAHNELRLATMADGKTEVRYASDVSIFGRLGKFGLGMMKKRAATTGSDFAKAFTARVEAASALAETQT